MNPFLFTVIKIFYTCLQAAIFSQYRRHPRANIICRYTEVCLSFLIISCRFLVAAWASALLSGVNDNVVSIVALTFSPSVAKLLAFLTLLVNLLLAARLCWFRLTSS